MFILNHHQFYVLKAQFVLQRITKELIIMSTISVRLDDQDTRLIKEYAKAKNITISTLVRDAVLDRIEDEIDLQLYHDSMAAHRKKSEAISFGDMMKELDLE